MILLTLLFSIQLNLVDDEIHYFSIVNSLMIVIFLTGVVAMIMMRTVHKDIAFYNEMQTLEETQEESGWKLVHGKEGSCSPFYISLFNMTHSLTLFN